MSLNASLLQHLSPTIYDLQNECFGRTVGIFTISSFTITSLLIILPLCTYVLFLGAQRWRRSSNMALSHSDAFAYHMAVTELVGVLGSTLICGASRTGFPPVTFLGIYLCNMNFAAQIIFHVLTCVERYLAVVHPVTYLKLRKEKGIRMRNISIGLAWLLSVSATGLLSVRGHVYTIIMYLCFGLIPFSTVSFCSLSVLWVLSRPGPGERGGKRQQVDQSKLRAFYTIMAILGVLAVMMGRNLICTALYASRLLQGDELCGLLLSGLWFCLPSSLVLPLLYLHRAGKLMCCKKGK